VSALGQPQPPQDLDSEQAILGVMLLEREAVVEATATLTAADFYHEPHRILFALMAHLADEGPLDIVTVRGRLTERDELVAVGGPPYLAELIELAPTGAMAKRYAGNVKRTAIRRRRWLAALRFSENPMDAEAEIALADAFSEVERAVEAVGWAEVADTSPDIGWLVEGLAFRGGLTILSGPGGAGKSYLALALAHAVANGSHWLGQFPVKESGPVVYVDAERGRLLMGRRLREIEVSAGRPSDVHFVFRPPKLDPAFLRSLAREHKPALMVLDSLSRLLPDGVDENSNAAMTVALESVRFVAEEFGTALWLLHHDRKPQAFQDNAGAARVRGASAIVNVADVVLCASQDAEGRIIVQTAKTWFGDPIPTFAARFTQDPDTDAVALLFDGQLENRATQTELCRQIVLEALAQGARTRQELFVLVERQSVGRRTAIRTLADLEKAGQIQPGNRGKERTWSLAQ